MQPLVTIGDSLTQGFASGAIHRTDLSYPALLARALGVHGAFAVPDFFGAGGLPINLELLLRELSRHHGERIDWWDVVPATARARSILDTVEDFWERGKGSKSLPGAPLHHNVAVWGFEVADALSVTERACRDNLGPARDDAFQQIPSQAMYRTARRTLNPTLGDATADLAQLDVAEALAAGGGIERLVVWLGANNALGTVTSLTIVPSEAADLHRLPHQRRCNLYRPEHFAAQYEQLAARVGQLDARHVFVATVPHVTIPPVTRGVSPDGSLVAGNAAGRKYYAYYTRPWVWDSAFDPDRHAHLTRAQAIAIDDHIDAYNETIRRVAEDRGWHLFDACDLLDRLAFRSQAGATRYAFPDGLARALRADPDLHHLVDANGVRLDTRFFAAMRDGGRYRLAKGGIFSLDGIHPTTLGYAVLAHELLTRMQEVGAAPDEATIPWNDVVRADTLVAQPPALMASLQSTLGHLDRRGWLSQLLERFDDPNL